MNDRAAEIFDYDQDGNADELGNPQTSPGTISDGGFGGVRRGTLRGMVGASSVNLASLV